MHVRFGLMATKVLRPWWFDGHIAGNFNSGHLDSIVSSGQVTIPGEEIAAVWGFGTQMEV
ncbi:hypothetical protein OROMI_030567 [Orobanche minor]